jgi:hypothetical protein
MGLFSREEVNPKARPPLAGFVFDQRRSATGSVLLGKMLDFAPVHFNMQELISKP